MKITVHTIINVYCVDYGPTEMDVLGTFIDENKARECFETQKRQEMEFAKEYDWEIDDGEMDFVAYEDGNYNNNFTQLSWLQEEFEIKEN